MSISMNFNLQDLEPLIQASMERVVSQLDLSKINRQPTADRDERLLYTPPKAARLLSISEKSLWNHTIPRGPTPCVRIGSTVRYHLDDLRAWTENQKGASGADQISNEAIESEDDQPYG